MSLAAAQNADNFYIGIDANVAPLQKPSMKATRKISKGGLPNALFVQATVEDLPSELDGIANEIFINFPWGSLLRGVATGDPVFLASLRRLCAQGCEVNLRLGFDEVRDRSETDRLGVPAISDEYVINTLLPRYRVAGFEKAALRSGVARPGFNTTWERKLSGRPTRTLIDIVLRSR